MASSQTDRYLTKMKMLFRTNTLAYFVGVATAKKKSLHIIGTWNPLVALNHRYLEKKVFMMSYRILSSIVRTFFTLK